MAEIHPIRAWRYRHDLNIDQLTSPLFDVISPRQQKALYKIPHNSIHLSVPQGPNPPKQAKDTLNTWKREGILVQDKLPGIYVHYQYFSLHGDNNTYCRKGIVVNLKVADWYEKIILRHENTISFSVQDRIDILSETQLNASPTHGMYTDADRTIESLLDEAIRSPIYETEDYQGVRDVFSVIHDAQSIHKIRDSLDDKQIILADGHHRYEGSLAYMKSMRENDPTYTGQEGYNYHMMFLTNTEQDMPVIQPTHRLVSKLPMSSGDLLERLRNDFKIKEIGEPVDAADVILGKRWAFSLLIGDQAFRIKLKKSRIPELMKNYPGLDEPADLMVLHYFVFEKIFGLSTDAQRSTSNIQYQRNFAECLREVIKGEADAAFITKEIPMTTVKNICYSGYTLPQKSTSFYPKNICGFLFGSIKQDEFDTSVTPSI
jgi:uncharacterized protein (DUF1015 family)